jgi:signal transduction histidine kinase
VIALRGLPDEHLQWIIDHSEHMEFEDGALVARTGAPADVMWILLDGKIAYYSDVNGTLVYYLTFENDELTGGITGLIPHSRMKEYHGSSFSLGRLRGLSLHKKYFPELEKLNPEFVQRLIGYMTERAKTFATIQLQHEKVNALGKLSAGIAHEMNNPAAAINRIASELKKRLAVNYELTSKLIEDRANPESLNDLRLLAEEKEDSVGTPLTALKRMEREDEIEDWFEANGFAVNRQAAETFSEFGFSTADLDRVCTADTKQACSDMLRWVENLLISGRLIKDLEDASGRISHLVGAIKSHVRMDRTHDLQRTDIHIDIENTLTLMGYKLRDKNITIAKHFCKDLPPVEAYIGELNQVWTNLIDNAIDAMEKNGALTIETSFKGNSVTVRITDTGSGIPKEIQSRVFDPFFTTKKVGQGTGIGLDLVKNIIDRHHGNIKLESAPGRTSFDICIPIAQDQETR